MIDDREVLEICWFGLEFIDLDGYMIEEFVDYLDVGRMLCDCLIEELLGCQFVLDVLQRLYGFGLELLDVEMVVEFEVDLIWVECVFSGIVMDVRVGWCIFFVLEELDMDFGIIEGVVCGLVCVVEVVVFGLLIGCC